MKLVFYAEGQVETANRLLQRVKEQLSADIIKAYRTFDDFKQGLLQQRQKPHTAILVAANAKDLKRIITLDKLLTDMRIVLVLPDRRKETVSVGHRLRPRYISYADSDFVDTVAVVKQILKLFPPHEFQESENPEIENHPASRFVEDFLGREPFGRDLGAERLGRRAQG